MHAALNTTALSLYLASLVARPGTEARRRGAGPGRAGTPVLADTELADGELCRADAGGVPVLLYQTDGTVYALASTCTHMGGPLEEGTISDGCVTCPWPGSTVRFADGSIVRSPAGLPEPSYQPRIQNGRIQVPCLHIGVADLSHRRGSSQKSPFCAPRTDPTKEAVPLQIGGSARGYQELSAPPAIPATADQAGGQAVCLCIANAGRVARFCRG